MKGRAFSSKAMHYAPRISTLSISTDMAFLLTVADPCGTLTASDSTKFIIAFANFIGSLVRFGNRHRCSSSWLRRAKALTTFKRGGALPPRPWGVDNRIRHDDTS